MKRHRLGAWIGQETYADKKPVLTKKPASQNASSRPPGPLSTKPSAASLATIAKRSNVASQPRTTHGAGGFHKSRTNTAPLPKPKSSRMPRLPSRSSWNAGCAASRIPSVPARSISTTRTFASISSHRWGTCCSSIWSAARKRSRKR